MRLGKKALSYLAFGLRPFVHIAAMGREAGANVVSGTEKELACLVSFVTGVFGRRLERLQP